MCMLLRCVLIRHEQGQDMGARFIGTEPNRAEPSRANRDEPSRAEPARTEPSGVENVLVFSSSAARRLGSQIPGGGSTSQGNSVYDAGQTRCRTFQEEFLNFYSFFTRPPPSRPAAPSRGKRTSIVAVGSIFLNRIQLRNYKSYNYE